MDLTLKEIGTVLNRPVSMGRTGKTVESIVIDSRKVLPGALFVAVKGEKFDGHDFVDQALSKGCIGAVVSRDIRLKQDASAEIFRVDDTIDALNKIAGYYRKKLRFPVIGITGSNGKTTTKEMVAAVLSEKYRVEKTTGNLNNHIGVPLSILSWEENADFGVLELGANHTGEIRNLCRTALPSFGIITNIGKGHIGFFGSEENILKAKTELIDSLPEGSTVFLNGDDPKLRLLKPKKVKIVFFGFSQECSIRPENSGKIKDTGMEMMINKTRISLNIPGVYNLYNAMAAIAVGVNFNIPMDKIKSALENFRSVQNRSEILLKEPFTLINDTYNANPDSMEAAFRAASNIAAGHSRLIAVLGDMFELGRFSKAEHEVVGEKLKKYNFSALFCIGKDMVHTYQAAVKSNIQFAEHFESMEDLISSLIKFIKRGDTVLIKGSRGMQMERASQALVDLSKLKDWGK